MSNDVNYAKPAEDSAACIALSKNNSYVMSAYGGKGHGDFQQQLTWLSGQQYNLLLEWKTPQFDHNVGVDEADTGIAELIALQISKEVDEKSALFSLE